jgi:hypothetical protein
MSPACSFSIFSFLHSRSHKIFLGNEVVLTSNIDDSDCLLNHCGGPPIQPHQNSFHVEKPPLSIIDPLLEYLLPSIFVELNFLSHHLLTPPRISKSLAPNLYIKVTSLLALPFLRWHHHWLPFQHCHTFYVVKTVAMHSHQLLEIGENHVTKQS